MRDTKHLESFARERSEKEKEKSLFKNKIKAVNKGKIADSRILKSKKCGCC